MTRAFPRPVANAMARASAALLLLSGTLLAAQQHSAPLPGSFNDQWCAYRTAHFELFTDLSHRRAIRTVNGLVRFRRMFVALYPETAGQESLPLTMLVFRNAQDFADLSGTHRYAGVTLPSMLHYRLLSAAKQSGAATDNAWHEYTHYLLRNRSGRNYPLWYEEGLASYLGAADLQGNRVILGKLPRRDMLAVPHDPLVTFASAVEATSVLDLGSEEMLSFYAKAWLMVHFLRLGPQSGFPDQQVALARYLDSPARDFASAFGYPPQQLGARLADYLRKRPWPRRTLQLADTPTPKPERRCLEATERDYQLAYSVLPLNPGLSKRVLERLQPSARNLTARAEAAWGDWERARSLVDQALALEPEHPDANVQFAHLLVRGCAFSSDSACIGNWARAVTLYRDVLERHPARIDAAYGLGVAYLHTGRADEAMHYLRIAYQRLPSNVPINFYLGEGYRIAGDARAGAHLKNARNWARDSLWRERAEFALQRLQQSGSR